MQYAVQLFSNKSRLIWEKLFPKLKLYLQLLTML